MATRAGWPDMAMSSNIMRFTVWNSSVQSIRPGTLNDPRREMRSSHLGAGGPLLLLGLRRKVPGPIGTLRCQQGNRPLLGARRGTKRGIRVSDLVLVDVADGIALVTLNRPETRNAL